MSGSTEEDATYVVRMETRERFGWFAEVRIWADMSLCDREGLTFAVALHGGLRRAFRDPL